MIFFCLVSVNILRSFVHLQYFDIHADLAGSPLKCITSETLLQQLTWWQHLQRNTVDFILVSKTGNWLSKQVQCVLSPLFFALHTLCNLENMQAYIIMCPCRHLTCLWFQSIVQYVYNRLNIEDYHMVFMMFWGCDLAWLINLVQGWKT